MKIEVRFRGLDASDSLREHAMRQVQSHLSRFGQDLAGVVVRIADTNGPKGGIDKKCQITVRGPRVGESSLEELADDGYAAVSVAAERIARTVGRGLERAREERRNAVSVSGRKLR